MLTKPAKKLFWYLPSQVRRKLAVGLMPERYQGFHKKLRPEAQARFGSTLRPFVDHECIFVHIPKSAGLSVTNSLFGSITGSHMKIVEYQTMFSQKEFDHFFKFTFVRNPWDRVVSAFIYLKKGGMNENNRTWALENLSAYNDFNTFATKWINKKNIRSHSHFRPQYQFVCLPGKREPAVDFIGYFENLEADYSFVRGKIGTGVELRTMNVTSEKQRDYRSYYSEETKQIVADVYCEDIELFGYDFDNHSVQSLIAKRKHQP
jgi:hypothetical protein